MNIKAYVVCEKTKHGAFHICALFKKKNEAKEYYDMVDYARGSKTNPSEFIRSKFEIVTLKGKTIRI